MKANLYSGVDMVSAETTPGTVTPCAASSSRYILGRLCGDACKQLRRSLNMCTISKFLNCRIAEMRNCRIIVK